MPPAPKDLALKLLTGGFGEASAARAERIRAIVRTVVGDEPPSVPPQPEMKPAAPAKLIRLRGDVKERHTAIRTATVFAEAFISRETAELKNLAHPALWMLWPTGELHKHATPVLADALSKRPGKPASLIIGDARSYTASEMRGAFARGVAEAMESMFAVQNGLAVTMAFEAKTGVAGIGMVWVSQDKYETWRAHSAVLPTIDEAFRMSDAASPDEDDAVRYADRIVRHFMLGHSGHIKSLRNHFHEKVLFGDQVITPEDVAINAGAGSHKIEANDLVFGRSELGAFEDIPNADKLKRRTKEIWGKPIEKLTLKVVRTKAGDEHAVSLMLAVKQDPAKDALSWRLAGLFV